MIGMLRNEVEQAETLFLQAISVADRQDACLFEVRAAHGLAEMFAKTARSGIGRRQLQRALSSIPAESPLADVRKARQFGAN